MFKRAIASIEPFYNDVKVLVVSPGIDLKDFVLSEKLDINFYDNKGDSSFCSQINIGAKSCGTEYFSILEIDDEYRPIWLSSIYEYIQHNPDVDVFLPIVKDINVEGKFLSFTNESAWAFGFTDKQGFIDNEVLLDFQNYQTSGGVFKTSVFNENGGFKENIKLTFTYELLLRLTHNGVKIMTVPKIGYQHVNFREDSLFWSYKNDEKNKVTEKEIKFWLETAKKEFFFKNKRDINYIES